MLTSNIFKSIEDNKLNIIIGFLNNKFNITRSGSCQLKVKTKLNSRNYILPLTAAKLDVKYKRIEAASYFTECEAAVKSSDKQRI